MPGFESIKDQEKPIKLLTTLLLKETVPHAFLFTGIEGVGKRTAAMTFAMACNCSSQARNTEYEIENEKKIRNPIRSSGDPCYRCRSCRKIKSGNHPDIIFIRPSGPFIRIAQIRTICSTLALKPYEAKLRVVIISDAQSMNPEASNALLKVLEEPPDRTILILIAMQTSDLLPTIVSRCQHIRFNPISRKSIEDLLVNQQGLEPDEAIILATIANGSFSKALSMIKPLNKINWINKRNWLINASGLDKPETLSLQPIRSLLAFAEKLSKNKEILSDSLEVIKSWLRDLIIYKYYPEKIINRDLTHMIRYASQKSTVKSVLSKIDAIQSAQRDIKANANVRLTLEVMTMRLAKG